MAKDAVKIDANTFQFFTRNPRGGNAKAIDEKDVKAFLLKTEEEDISPILRTPLHFKCLFCRSKVTGFRQTYHGRRSCKNGVYTGEYV